MRSFLKISILAAVMILSLQVKAQTVTDVIEPITYNGISKLFIEEKGEIFNSLSLATRYTLLNNYGKESKKDVVNDLETSETHLLKLNDDYMLIATSSARTVEMKMLPKSKKDTVVVVIETVAMPYKDSRITFYDTKWNPLATDEFITPPTIDDFIVPKAPQQLREELKSAVYFAMIEMKLEDDTLVAQCNLEDFFLGESFTRYSSIVTKKVVYDIKKAKFKKVK